MEILCCLLADSLSLTTLANGSTTITAAAAAAYTTVTGNLGHVFCCKKSKFDCNIVEPYDHLRSKTACLATK